MKKLNKFLFLLIAVIAITNPLRAQWVQTNTPSLGGIVMSFCVSDSDLISGTGHGIFYSADNGTTWTEVLPWTKLEFVSTFIEVPTESDGTNLFAGGLGGVYKSTNGGTSWIAANSGLENQEVRSLAVSTDETGTTTLFAGTAITSGGTDGTTGGVFRSTDYGTSWSACGLDSSDVYAVTVIKDETGTPIILAGIEANNNGTIFRSTDNGSSWTAATLFTYFTASFAADPNESGPIYAGTYSGIFKSTDSGINWTHLDGGPNWSVHSLTFCPNGIGGMNFFAGTFNGGVFLSTNNGENWSAVNTGLTYEDESVTALAVSGNYIFASTSYLNGGVWRRPVSEILASVTSVNYSENVPSNFQLDQNYPNPFNPSTKISWKSPVSGHQLLKVYDVLGNEVATLVDEEKPAGSYEIEFDASKLSSGTYFYQLRAGSLLETRKMVLLK